MTNTQIADILGFSAFLVLAAWAIPLLVTRKSIGARLAGWSLVALAILWLTTGSTLKAIMSGWNWLISQAERL